LDDGNDADRKKCSFSAEMTGNKSQ